MHIYEAPKQGKPVLRCSTVKPHKHSHTHRERERERERERGRERERLKPWLDRMDALTVEISLEKCVLTCLQKRYWFNM